jgi:thioesterase domain-containing protein/acyl carrier protein
VRAAPAGPTLGRPLQNVRTYVLDTQMQPMPVGVPGELHIGGDGLARGYLGRPDLTAERFVPDPFCSTPGARLYRTGDRVRYRADGTLEFLGRIDFQVKIRGFRVELGEIEAALLEQPALRQALVMAREDAPGDKRLVAYVVPEAGQTLEVTALRSALQQRLPEHMVPSAFVLLAALPLNPNGKVDRRALPAPGAAERPDFVAPRDLLELQVAALWEEVLRTRPVGVTQSFFDLGGHSLLAVSLMLQIERRLGRKLPLSTLFTHPTVEALASLLRTEDSRPAWTPLVSIQPHGARTPLFCVHPIGGSAFCYTLLARHLGQEQPLYGLEARGLDGESPPFHTIEEMATAYVEAICRVQPEGPFLLAGWSLGGVVAFEMARQLTRRGQRVGLVALLDSWSPTLAGVDVLPPLDDTSLLLAFALDLGRALGRAVPISRELLEPLTPEARRTMLLERTRDAGLVLPALGLRELRALIDVFRAHRQALQQYVPGRDEPVPLAIFRPEAEVAESTKGWETTSCLPASYHRVPGDHYSMLAEPHVKELTQKLLRVLDEIPAAEDVEDAALEEPLTATDGLRAAAALHTPIH